MKMTPRLWRILSVWICIAAVNCCYVAGNGLHQEVQKSASSQDFSLEEVSVEDTPHHKVDESLVLPVQPLPGQELSLEESQLKDEQATQDEAEPHSETSEVKVPDVDVAENTVSTTDPGTEPSLINPEPRSVVDQELDSTALLPSPEPVTASPAELSESHPTNVPDSAVEDGSHGAVPEVLEPNTPPPDCEEGREEEEINNPYDSESPAPTVLENTSNAHTGGTITLTDPPLTPPAATPDTEHMEAQPSDMDEQSSSVAMDADSTAGSKDPEDIPTFDEWKRKMMEVEKEKTVTPVTTFNGGSHVLKKAQKNLNNYASVECGAKILGANPEAKSTSAVLKENMDLYMLNPCSHKIWFIVELCEPIQLKQLDIANFELFSSTPKDFLVSISDRYPTNKWLKLGTFHARDERTVQSFPLDEHLYAKYVKMFTKYIKVELLSHFGSEHFCPLSLIRVFGTSMVEEYEEITDPSERPDDQDDELDYPGCAPGEVKLSKNLIGSAKDVILNMVNNIAANVLGGSPDMQANASSHGENVSEPSVKLETVTQTATTDITSASESDVVEPLPDPGISEPAASSSETSASETSDTNLNKQPPPPVEDQKVDASEGDEEKPISSTIILLDKEEEEEESDGRKEKPDHKKQQENLPNPCCPASSQCCFADSLKEYLTRRCLALQFKKRICQTAGKKQMFPTVKPSWQEGEEQQLDGKENPAEQQPVNEASTSEATPPLGTTVESHKEPVSDDPIVLEPSQTLSLFQTDGTDSSTTDSTSSTETLVLPSGETATKEQRPEPSLHIPTTDRHSADSVSSSSSISSSVEAVVTDAPELDSSTSVQISESLKTDPTLTLLPSTSLPSEHQHDQPTTTTAPTEDSHPALDNLVELETSSGHPIITEAKTEDLVEDMSTPLGIAPSQGLHPASPLPPSPSLSDIYAETANVTEQNGNMVHGSSQKESVFMRLNNRIKALEINMSLSGRYLEQLSQRYRKQMEEMQKAFNKTIIKLQNTSRIAEEQDLRQTEHIQLLQGQLHNVTQLVLNLSVRVSQLQSEVSGSQNYLLLSLVLCLGLGLLLCTSHCHISTVPTDTEVELTTCKNYTYSGSESRSTSYKDTGLKKSASYPLIHSDSLQLITPEAKEILHTQSLCPANRKKRRRKLKPVDQVETLKPSLLAASELNVGALVCNGVPVTNNPAPFIKTLLQPVFRDSPSEAGSEGSSHSDDPSFCGIATACPQICDSLPLPKTRSEKRALRRRRPKPNCAVVDLLQAPKRDRGEPIPTIEETENKKTEKYPGTFGVNVLLSGPV